MDKKYQVFVSSTYEDLKDERNAVIQALLNFNCFPVGMEWFPASDDDQWTLIKNIISNCDYYVLILGGRYGSVNSAGLSYTQAEYEFAQEQKIPILAFLYKNPDDIPVGNTDKDTALTTKLQAFRKQVETRMCKYFTNPAELGGMVLSSINSLMTTHPRDGWVRSTQMANEKALQEIISLRDKVALLETELSKQKPIADIDVTTLSQGDEKYTIEYFIHHIDAEGVGQKESANFVVSWNGLFKGICEIMLFAAETITVRETIESFIKKEEEIYLGSSYETCTLSILDEDFISILLQLKFLGLIVETSIEDSMGFFSAGYRLTDKGKQLRYHLKLIRSKKRGRSSKSKS